MTTSSEAEEEMMVTKLGLHALSGMGLCRQAWEFKGAHVPAPSMTDSSRAALNCSFPCVAAAWQHLHWKQNANSRVPLAPRRCHCMFCRHSCGDHIGTAAAQAPQGEAEPFGVSSFVCCWSKLPGLPLVTPGQLSPLFPQCVRLSQLMADFAWLLEETLLRQHDVSFSGQLRALVLHSLAMLRAHLTLYHLAPLGDVLVVVKDSAETQWELSCHSTQIVPIFASEAVGGERWGAGGPCVG